MIGCKIIGRSMHNGMQPMWSTTNAEARHRVVKLYKIWYRQIPHIVNDYNLPLSTDQCRAKLHAEFMKNKYLTDIRQIDVLVIQKQLELKEICFMQKNRMHLLNYWSNETGDTPVFLAKFFVGQN